MANYSVKQKSDIAAIEEKYRERCHGVQKHKAGTFNLFKRFSELARIEFGSRQAGNPANSDDLWAKLYKYNEAKKSGVTGKLLRQHLREFLEEQQGYLCCYCRRPLVNISNAKPIEHVLPRQPFVQHTFHFWNLAIACFDCNHAKSNKFWVNPVLVSVEDYPNPEDFSDWYHPRFHTYDEHVRFVRIQTNTVNISLYIGQTVQGKSLCKNLLKTISAKDILLSSNLALKESVDKLHDHTPSLDGEAALAVEAFNKSLADMTLKLIDER
jgi:uncharacterized protein (TIGR02646 family)